MARSMVLYLMLLHRQTVLRPRMAGCCDSWSSSIPADLNAAAGIGLPDLGPGPGRRGHSGFRDPGFGKRARQRERVAGRALLPVLRLLHAVHRSRMRAASGLEFCQHRSVSDRAFTEVACDRG